MNENFSPKESPLYYCKLAVHAYYQNGSIALDYLRRKEWDQAERLLRQKTFNFKRFCSIYEKLSESGKKYLQQELRKLWENIEEQNREIIEIIYEFKDDLRSQKMLLIREKNALEKFLSEKNKDTAQITILT